jgi:SAM-dependent methyltransferase
MTRLPLAELPAEPPSGPAAAAPRAAARRRLLASALGVAVLAASVAPGARAQAGEEVPFITTPDHVTLAMLDLARVGPADTMIDLGSGDGRIVITAARRFGARGLGVEIMPDLVLRSRENAAKAGVADRAEFREQDLFKTDLSPYSVITMYLLPEVNLQLRPLLLKLKPGTRVVSHDWDMAEWRPDRTVTLDVPDKAVGREKLSRVHLWVVPAPVEGLWCGPGGAQIRLDRSFQLVQGRAGAARDVVLTQGRIDGNELHLASPGAALRARWAETGGQRTLRVTGADGAWQAWREVTFLQGSGELCRI